MVRVLLSFIFIMNDCWILSNALFPPIYSDDHLISLFVAIKVVNYNSWLLNFKTTFFVLRRIQFVPYTIEIDLLIFS